MIRQLAVATTTAVILTGLAVTPAFASPEPPPPEADVLAVYTGTVDAAGLAAIADSGVDRHEIVTSAGDEPGEVEVQVILSPGKAAELAAAGAALEPKQPAAQRRSLAAGDGVFRPYSGEGGLLEELQQVAAANPQIADFRVIGQTTQGKPIGAVRVTKNPQGQSLGVRPTTVYVGAQHAREWITPEMVRRLLQYFVASYGSDPKISDLVDTTELWFVPVANPDGYDFTFQDGWRLWRKNLRDNDGNGVINTADGVDLNRNFPTRWGYDNEGSSPDPGNDTYRGPSPASEPETQALDRLFADLTPQFLVNYHSAAELLLHGIGWQVATPSPDDVIYEAMVGDDAKPAVPGYDPDISAELYTTNGDTDSHAQEAYGILGFTPEMATCQTASDSEPDDEWNAQDCDSVFNFPDDEELIQAEFQKNILFALAVAESAKDPDDPVSVVGRDAEDFRVDSFSVSYGDPQTVAVWAKHDLRKKQMSYRINGGRTTSVPVDEWQGGERYGAENTDYYGEYRGVVTGAAAGDSVEVWFTGRPAGNDNAGPGGKVIESEHFTYEVAQDTGNSVLVIANEDYTGGRNAGEPPHADGPKYLDEHVEALEANGITPDVWDVDQSGVPHDLGVLSHYDAVLWYLGDNRLTQDEEDLLTETYAGPFPDLSVAERQQYLTMAVRDFLNEGGKLALDGETTAYYGFLAGTIGGIYYGLDGAPEQQCVVTSDIFSDCLLLADDFTQYWLGAYNRNQIAGAGISGIADPLEGVDARFGGPAVEDNPVDEAGQLTATSDVLPVDQFPQFESWSAAEYQDPLGPFIPVGGEWAMFASHVDDAYQRLSRTYAVPELEAGQTAASTAQFSYATELGYDHVIVEARVAGTDDWTTLVDEQGGTTSAAPFECEAGFLLAEHPWLTHYLTPGNPCASTGDTGAWNSFTGSSDGWTPVSFDLSGYAGEDVEIVISYVTDPFTGDVGLMVDDTALVIDGAATETEGFETGTGAWDVLGAPEGSAGNASDFVRYDGQPYSATVTPDTLMFGFGLEQLETDAERAEVVARVLAHFAG